MAFTLRITHGTQTEELSFEGEVRLGRTADNDVVIKDAASSRTHARLYEEEGQVFVEDLKSANGTLLNGRALKAPALLETGDRISIGEVSLDFQAASGPSSTLDGEEDEPVDAQETLLKPPVSKPASAAVPKKKPTVEIAASAPPRRPTGAVQAVAARNPSHALPAEPTAADRARERRELQRSSMGRLQVLWSELPRPTRIGVGVASMVLTGVIALTVFNALRPRRVVHRAEPTALVPNSEPVAESFGAGAVDFSRPDMKSFTFTFPSPTAIVGVLHYQAKEIGKDEVTIELNGAPIGPVPPDTLDTDLRQLEQVLPSAQLHVNEPNELVFDSVANPPAHDPWQISNLWLEIIPVPRMSGEEAGRRAKDDLERAAKLFDLRGVGAMNLFRAWKQYRDAWLLLEATPESPPELTQVARTRMREIRPELDRKCAAMMVSYQREMNQRHPNIAGARRVLQDIPSYFEKEHPCYNTSKGLLASLEDLSEVE